MAENKKLATVEQLRLLAERSLLDTTGKLSAMLEQIVPLLESAQHAGITLTLPTSAWHERTQVAEDEGLLADGKYRYLVCGDASCFMACSETGIKADDITTNGQITFHCEITPEEDLTVNIIRLEVEQKHE